jgi:hypothetical protein
MLLMLSMRRALTAVAVAALLPAALHAQTGNASDIGGISVQGSALLSGQYAPRPLPVVPQPVVQTLLTAAPGSEAAATAQTMFLNALTSGPDAPSVALVQQLSAALVALGDLPTAEQLLAAITAFNAVVQGAGVAFLQNPPAEFRAVHALLTGMLA